MGREGPNESSWFQGLPVAFELFTSCTLGLPRWKELHCTGLGRRLNGWKACCTNMRIWVWILRTHVKPDVVVCTCNLSPFWDTADTEKEFLEVCGPASLAYTAVNTRPCLRQGKWRLSLAVDPWAPYVIHSTCVPTFTHTHTHTPTHRRWDLKKRKRNT